VGDADVADGAARARDPDGRLHRRLRADAFEHVVDAAVRAFVYRFDGLLTACAHQIRRAELLCDLQSVLVVAHGDDAFGTQSPGREHATETDRAVTDDRTRGTGVDARADGRVVAGTHHVRQREQRAERLRVVGVPVRHLHQCAVRLRTADVLALSAAVVAAPAVAVHTGRVDTLPAELTLATGDGEGCQHAVAGFD